MSPMRITAFGFANLSDLAHYDLPASNADKSQREQYERRAREDLRTLNQLDHEAAFELRECLDLTRIRQTITRHYARHLEQKIAEVLEAYKATLHLTGEVVRTTYEDMPAFCVGEPGHPDHVVVKFEWPYTATGPQIRLIGLPLHNRALLAGALSQALPTYHIQVREP